MATPSPSQLPGACQDRGNYRTERQLHRQNLRSDQGYELWGEPHATAAPSLRNSGKLEALRRYYRKDFPDTEGTACPSLGILENRTEAGKHLQDRELFLGFEYPRFHLSVCSRPHQLPAFPLQWLHYPETGQPRTEGPGCWEFPGSPGSSQAWSHWSHTELSHGGFTACVFCPVLHGQDHNFGASFLFDAD